MNEDNDGEEETIAEVECFLNTLYYRENIV